MSPRVLVGYLDEAWDGYSQGAGVEARDSNDRKRERLEKQRRKQ